MKYIPKQAMEFLEEAKIAFEGNYKMITYRDKNDNFIALRNGFDESDIDIYEISNKIGRFENQLPSQRTETVLYDELDKLKNSEKILSSIKIVTDHYYEKYNDDTIRGILTSFYEQLNRTK